MVARSWNATFVWDAHYELAIAAGLPLDALEEIRHGRPPVFRDRDAVHAYWLLYELLDRKTISDRTWRSTISVFGERNVVDLIGIAGYYGMVAMTVVAVDLEPVIQEQISA